MKKLLLLFPLLLLYALWSLPASRPVTVPPLPSREQLVLLPLDSRPVCTSLVKDLGTLVGTTIILPPKELLDNYQEPAKKEKLLLWLEKNNTAPAIISLDLLLQGGLLASRLGPPEEKWQKQVLSSLFQKQGPHYEIFSVIPRQLVSDQLLPDRWYKYRLLDYSRLSHMEALSSDPSISRAKAKIQVPDQVLGRYQQLFASHQQLQYNLVALSSAHKPITIGQDDGSPMGLPQLSAYNTALRAQQLQKEPYARLTWGADELAALLLAKYKLAQSAYKPKVHLYFARPEDEALYLPYMAASTGATLRAQLQLLGLQEANYKEADFLIYISCGHDGYKPGKAQANELKALLQGPKPVALIDLTANYTEQELLLPLLLEEAVPLHQLLAYAGWNTFSNSSGTVLAQGALTLLAQRQLQEKGATCQELLAFQVQRLKILCTRLLDDYVYQKQLHADLNTQLALRGYHSRQLDKEGELVAEYLTDSHLQLQATKILYTNLGRSPFYREGPKNYYLRHIAVEAVLPWDRTFEVEVQVNLEIGQQQ